MDAGRMQDSMGLEDLVALNDEIRALVQAGVPLGKGLGLAGGELGGRAGRLSKRLAERLERGESLEAALEAEGSAVPLLYRSVVVAGLKAGRLPAALEGLATYARRVAELRKSIGLALVYPMVVLVLGYLMFLGLVLFLAPRMMSAFESLQLESSLIVTAFGGLEESVWWWWPVFPALLLGAWLGWAWTGQAKVLDLSRAGNGLGWVPWMRGLLSNAKAAMFADLVALLLSSRVPLHDAVRLAAAAIGSSWKGETSLEGTRQELRLPRSAKLPPMIEWLLTSDREPEELIRSLRHAAEVYQQKAQDRGELIRIFVPVILMMVLGGGAVLLYGLSLFVPFTRLLEDLSV